MSTLVLPPEEFAVLRKIIEALQPAREREALRDLIREIVREELGLYVVATSDMGAPADIRRLAQEVRKVVLERERREVRL